MQATDWFRGVKPVRNGIYERREDCLCCVSAIRWTGTRFYRANFSGEIVGFIGDKDQDGIVWRGLAEQPA
ncbi:hypothetical protein R69746_05642 [Paraburkholderia aspalathi]|uniref:hypothetical protein n=1 Tax=Paraburkholderia aspalathi TaxID=1324617 RepID=UPI001909967B|nr:hypothetical protein [Paraburkholderia aspalathi]MBK3841735.1 hypothetical protein [Paraburkholderia aspalathi]CAE6811508.1 hypothetical protein R69746_05642 [Paraburkholderia aspalathi]